MEREVGRVMVVFWSDRLQARIGRRGEKAIRTSGRLIRSSQGKRDRRRKVIKWLMTGEYTTTTSGLVSSSSGISPPRRQSISRMPLAGASTTFRHFVVQQAPNSVQITWFFQFLLRLAVLDPNVSSFPVVCQLAASPLTYQESILIHRFPSSFLSS